MARPTLLHFFFWLIVLCLFAGLAFWLILLVAGLRIHWPTQKIVKTGIIFLDGSPRDATISIKGRPEKRGFPIKKSYLLPGRYEVLVAKKGYQSWQKSLVVDEGQVADQKNILLFLANPQKEESTDPKLKALVAKKIAQTETALLSLDGEIWYKGSLITRFSKEILSLALAPDDAHIFFQQGPEIHAIDLDGSNDVKILTKESETPAPLVLIDAGKTLLYLEGERLIKATIR